VIQQRLRSADEQPFGDAGSIFTESMLTILQQHFRSEVLQTKAFFTERLSNRVLAACLVRGGSCIIAINTRFKVDPEILAHTLLEEFAHVEQVFAGVDFETQRRMLAYQNRPYEQEAKRIATAILGYDPDDYDVYLIREEPIGFLYDRPTQETNGDSQSKQTEHDLD
jgi:hypothetical protein